MRRILAAILILLALAFPATAEEDIELSLDTAFASEDETTDWRSLLRPEIDASGLLGASLPQKKVTILTHYRFGLERYAEHFERLYGGEVELILCSVNEYSSKLSNLIAAGSPPDLVVCESAAQPSLVVLSNAGLIQPFDPYITYDAPELQHLKNAYDAGLWNDCHYLAPYELKPIYACIFNPQIFDEYGLQTPWELWLEGKWDWLAYRDMAEKLNIPKDGGGMKIFGTAIPPFGALAVSTGVDYVRMDNGAYTINLKNASITRAENFLNDMIYKDDIIKLKAQNAWKSFFQRGTLAVQITEFWQIEQLAELASAAKKGRLGIVPCPQDPAINTGARYDTYAMSGGFALVEGAQNPEGAALFIRLCAYLRSYTDESLSDGRAYDIQRLLDNGFTDQNIVQYLTAADMRDALVSFGYGFMSDAGGWDFLGDQNNWTTYVESILPGIQERIKELTDR